MVVLLGTIGLLLTTTAVFAANWYYSQEQATESVEWLVTLNSIPAQTTRYQNVPLSGTVKLGTVLQSSVTVHIFLELNSSGSFSDVGTAVTDGTGTFNYNHNNTEPAGTILTFRAGVFQ